jgi:hypothetical protein
VGFLGICLYEKKEIYFLKEITNKNNDITFGFNEIRDINKLKTFKKYYINRNKILNKFLNLNNNFQYIKISLNNKKIIDLEYNTIWLNIKKYKYCLELYEKLKFSNTEKEKIDLIILIFESIFN